MAVIDDHDEDATTQRSTPPVTLPNELAHLITAFLPSDPSEERSKAFLTLSAFCQGARASSKGQTPDPATDNLVKAFSPSITSRLAETETNGLLASVSFLSALFQVDWESAAAILQQDGVLESIMDIVDLNPSGELPYHVAQLFSQASGHKPSRSLLLSEALGWLETASKSSSDERLRAVVTTALVKLLKGSAGDRSDTLGETSQEDIPSPEVISKEEFVHAAVLKEIIISGGRSASDDAVEGLAYLSVNPNVKDNLSRDKAFLQKLFALIPSRRAGGTQDAPAATISTTVYGVLVIIANLCSYRPRLNEEESQMQKLRQMASANKKDLPPPSSLDNDDSVKARIKRLIEAGVLETFPSAMRVDSPRLCLAVGSALLGIVEDQSNRGKVLQTGGARVLGQIMKHAIPKHILDRGKNLPAAAIDPAYFGAVQALAKLAITASPIQVFGPNEAAMYDAIRPFSLMVQDPASNLLQKFEAMMALTNLSSQSPELAARVGKADGLLNRIELFLLEEHVMVRRAAMELMCNLIAGSDDVFDRYGGTSAKSRLQVVLALSDIDDVPTRLAASGAVATLTGAPAACQNLISLQCERHRAFKVLGRLIDPSAVPRDDSEEEGDEPEGMIVHAGLVHRALVVVKNVFSSVSDRVVRKKLAKEAEESGLPQAIRNFLKASLTDTSQAGIVRLGIEGLKAMDH